METRVSSATKEVFIGNGHPTVLIGERINPTGKRKLVAALQADDMQALQEEAIAQVQAGADILDVNVGVPGLDEVALLPRAVQAVMNAVDVPLCLDSHNPKAIEAALKVYQGKPLINSVNGEERSLYELLTLTKEYGAVVIGLTIDEKGIPSDASGRAGIARRIVERAEALGIPRENVVIDCLAMAIGADGKAGIVTIETIRKVKAELGVNMTLGGSNISFGLPDRHLLNGAFLAIAITAGITCPIVNVTQVRSMILATDLVLGRDRHAARYIKAYRQRQKG
ncbi:MAG: dihydropteroate synthase [Chloroflexi bacterium]|nr:dihydropteroate synthase [Chloroflexota bacterium]